MKTGGKLLVGGSLLGLAAWLLWPSEKGTSHAVGQDAASDESATQAPSEDGSDPGKVNESQPPSLDAEAAKQAARARHDRLMARYRKLKEEAQAQIPAGTKFADMTNEQKKIVLLLNTVTRQLAGKFRIVKKPE